MDSSILPGHKMRDAAQLLVLFEKQVDSFGGFQPKQNYGIEFQKITVKGHDDEIEALSKYDHQIEFNFYFITSKNILARSFERIRFLTFF